jgi:hypothetical protein
LKLHLSPEDILRGKLVDVGWHEGIVKSIDESAASTDQSTNWKLTIIIREGGKFDGVPLERYFNEKAPGFAINYLKACGFTIDEKTGGDFDLQKTVSRPIGFFVEIGEYQKRPKNEIKDFRPSQLAAKST